MVMWHKHTRLSKSRKGQARILEAVIAAAIIFIVFSVSMYLTQASNIKVMQERVDLDKLGYNVLHELIEAKTIEKTIEANTPENLRIAIQKSLPHSIYFTLTIKIWSGTSLNPLSSFSNAPTEIFSESLEVSSTSLIYTSQKGNIYQLILTLTKPWGENNNSES